MKKYISTLLILVAFIATPSNLHAQFFKKLQKKIDKKIEQVINPGEKESENSDKEIAENSSDTNSDNYRTYDDFKTGETILFKDLPEANEIVHKTPSKWTIFNTRKNDNTEIVAVDGEKMIRLAKNQGISPLMPGKEKDYIPENCTLEFDASFSANASDQRYYIVFFDLENQNDFVDWDVRDAELTLSTFGVTDNLTEGALEGHKCFEESPAPVWRHIAIKYQNNSFEIYYDGKHVFHKGDLKGNMIGLTISRSEFGTNDRYIKNVVIATNQ